MMQTYIVTNLPPFIHVVQEMVPHCTHITTLCVHAANVEDEYLACTTQHEEGKYFLTSTSWTNAADEFLTPVLAKHIGTSAYANTQNAKELDAALKERADRKKMALAKAHTENVVAATARDKSKTDTGDHDATLAANFNAELAEMNRMPVTSAAVKTEIKEAVVLCAAKWATESQKKPRPSKTYQARIQDGSMPLTVAEKLLAKVCKPITWGLLCSTVSRLFLFPIPFVGA